ncbi:hypothetical protein SB775_20345 [Peribacillus sp. SIMBA_075]|uniref:hypothetical protein n=1 Tax=Peribacillus sp. SIMBA_075 TaxID=3085813 RepID=UPI003978487B
MTHYLNRIAEDLFKAKLENYWPGFELVAYALYDKKNVYLFNHPKFSNNQQSTYHILSWDVQFTGDTIILYEEYPLQLLRWNRMRNMKVCIQYLFTNYFTAISI